MSFLEIEDRGSTRFIRLNRVEKRNAIDAQMISELHAAFSAAADESSIFTVVVSGNGPMFSSGADLKALASVAENPAELRPFRELMLSTWNLLEQMPKATIAAVHGACIGGALEMALACDMRIGTENSVFAIPETRVGIIPDVGGSSRLPAVIGLGRAKEMIMTSKFINGTEAERIGLTNRVCPDDGLNECVDQLINELAGCAPLAVGLAKRVMDASAKPALGATLNHEIDIQERLITTADVKEGMQAAIEKRPPQFEGR